MHTITDNVKNGNCKIANSEKVRFLMIIMYVLEEDLTKFARIRLLLDNKVTLKNSICM